MVVNEPSILLFPAVRECDARNHLPPAGICFVTGTSKFGHHRGRGQGATAGAIPAHALAVISFGAGLSFVEVVSRDVVPIHWRDLLRGVEREAVWGLVGGGDDRAGGHVDV